MQLFELRPTSVEDIKAAFAQADLNKDGFLSKTELRGILSLLQGAPEAPKMSSEELDQLFEAVDANADGRLNVAAPWCRDVFLL